MERQEVHETMFSNFKLLPDDKQQLFLQVSGSVVGNTQREERELGEGREREREQGEESESGRKDRYYRYLT